MRSRRQLVAAIGSLALAAQGPLRAQTPPRPVGEIRPLGSERYQIGQIVIDKRARRFTLPGRVLALGKPLEYLVTSPGGMKAYETLFEADTSGSEFNLACILIGLERDPDLVKTRFARPGSLLGPRVQISVSWQDGGSTRRLSALEALFESAGDAKGVPGEWVYVAPEGLDAMGRYGPDATGTLVGFKPDPNNLIESALPIGLGAYGSIRGNSALPPTGAPVHLTVEAVAPSK